jgi:hypothetical protein
MQRCSKRTLNDALVVPGCREIVVMKVVCLIPVVFLSAICASAQTSSNPPDVTVLQNKWRIEKYNPALDKDPMAPNKQRQAEELEQKANARDDENRARQGEPALPPSVRQRESETVAGRLKVMYVYEVKVKNTGRKEIRTLTWEYVFFEPGTTQEVGRLQSVSEVSMKPGTTKQLVVHTSASPTGTIDASKAGKKPSEQYSEQVVIRKIEYADGSVWSPKRN